ncbi:MAG: hypothetical protein G3M70_06995 [Candidatus Nitronauta litoralis]|uniref:Uncharacterized protein n=1 Tax=Candidatus Nitronauta litoralis TaxID=2705533 RepID=A0A7T0BVH7_9BACT|nr:MAG: hypothetical protein G3M70_06995 [Candidatus Nitronauta litoralis]
MNIVLSLEVQRIRQSTEVSADHVENRIILDGRLKCVNHNVSLGGVQPLSQAGGTVRLADSTDDPELKYDSENCVGRAQVLEEYGDWHISNIVVLPHEQHREIWDRLKHDKSLRAVKLLLSNGSDSQSEEKIQLNSKDQFQVEAVEIEFSHEI